MKLYELTFTDPEHGTIRRWKRNKREIDTFVNHWKRQFPLRELLLCAPIEIPDDKQGLIDWLNDHVGGAQCG